MVIAVVIIALQTVTSITELSIFNNEHQCGTLLGFWRPAFYSSFVMWKNIIFHQQQQRSISSKNIVRIPKFTLLLKSTFVKNPHSRILGQWTCTVNQLRIQQKNREVFENLVETSGKINKILGLQLRQDVLHNHCKGVYLKEIDKRKYQQETTQEYWQCVVLIDPRASSVKDFVDICDVIPLSEADVERLFSMVGLITTKRRVMIGNTLLNSLITVKKDTLQMYAE
ncbi:Hypothetical_protein [Hexamita inflata]|uniref:Hypothetical_protein n=1 Tax=Hexamita inflata TaxID=28002 RepID=A0AA86VR41_9EUKA|nr:Hypothetical protein HINF_LOCUS61818 [Hexamita inflata]